MVNENRGEPRGYLILDGSGTNVGAYEVKGLCKQIDTEHLSEKLTENSGRPTVMGA